MAYIKAVEQLDSREMAWHGVLDERTAYIYGVDPAASIEEYRLGLKLPLLVLKDVLIAEVEVTKRTPIMGWTEGRIVSWVRGPSKELYELIELLMELTKALIKSDIDPETISLVGVNADEVCENLRKAKTLRRRAEELAERIGAEIRWV